MSKRALIAMSGGVDSSVAAYLMKERGFDCIGITMKLFTNEEAQIGREKTCCSLDDINDARNVASRLDMPFYVLNFTADFNESVILRFIRAYENGSTPNPCIDCNRYIKFERLFKRAMELECDVVVTGHYARIEFDGSRYLLKKALDKSKDQSYVLYSLTQEQLSHAVFPLGNLNKSQTRKIAEEHGFINAHKRDSQDICFVPDGDYAKFIEGYTGRKYAPGDFIDKDGRFLGKHRGLIRYTIGQRKGIGLALPAPMYVQSKSVANNTVTLCDSDGLLEKELIAGDFNWISLDTFDKPIRVKAKVRYQQAEQWATASPLSDGQVHIVFDEPQRAIAPGQSVVLYDGDIVVGGGIITSG